MPHTAAKLSWKLMVNSALGSNNNMTNAARHKALKELCFRCRSVASSSEEAMIVARVTDGDSPVIIAKIHNNINITRYLHLRIYRTNINGKRRKEQNAVIIATCNPLSASMWAAPAVAKVFRVSSSRIEESPVMAVTRNSLVPLSRSLLNISFWILFFNRMNFENNEGDFFTR